MAETTLYRKRDTDGHDIDAIIKHRADTREAHAGVDGTPTTAENIELKVYERYHTDIRNMFRKHENMLTKYYRLSKRL